ncbi:MAG: hypothetical protein KF767_14140 [Bdellovibrionaceae bacterium]|nr:hypothetical protein [Pseudobdellovibrionaceae bacterium]
MRKVILLLLPLFLLLGDLAFAQNVRLRKEAPSKKSKAARAKRYEVAPHHARTYKTPTRLTRDAHRIEVPDEFGGTHTNDRVAVGGAHVESDLHHLHQKPSVRRSRKHAREASRLDALVRASAKPAPRRLSKNTKRPRPAPVVAAYDSIPSSTPVRSYETSTPVRTYESDFSLRTTVASETIERRLDRGDLFHAHGTESARTLRPWQFSYSRIAGTDSIEGLFLLNSVNVGVFDGIQVGTNPFLYTLDNSFNFSAKVGFYNSEPWAFALGYSHLTFSLSGFLPLRFHQNGLSVIGNYFLNDEWAFSYLAQMNHNYGALENSDFEHEQLSPISHYADVQYRFAPHWYSTFGLSLSPGKASAERIASMQTDPLTVGFGASLTWKYPKSWLFFYPSVGAHYYPSYATSSFLISAYFHP